ncbi:hypothetical protein OOZ15_11370 [Galbibacter sp. EGI 63066]|uniref:hypothetical protein n=1 Tax=Galbibacter sp. EGI 63066 TaxID=2993559 RepID=UPI0022490A52|nr:hypothetical protein [Galbibacter sp. EGI 63066]MCX2680542.1 hypothetical protein [Galbibacter sp. EGI 63066]
METTSKRKIDLTKRLLEVQDKNVLDKIEAILTETEIVAYTTKGRPLTRRQYIEHIEGISQGVGEGATTYTSQEIKHSILKR